MVLAAIDAGFAHFSQYAGLPPGKDHSDQFKLLTCFFATVVLGWVQWAVVRGTAVRHLFSLSLGLFLALVQYGPSGLAGFALTSVIVYALLCTVPRNVVGGYVLVFSFGYLSYVHIYRMLTDWMGWTQDASTMQMILTCKMVSLAFNYQDGASKELDPEQSRLSVANLPSLLEYYSYLTFFPGFLMGPVFEFTDYIKFIRRENEYQSIPSPVGQSAWLLLQALLCAGSFMAIFSVCHYSEIPKPEWAAHPYWYKILYYNLAMVGCKLRYYSAFKFSEAGIVASGLGFAGLKEDKSPDWNRVRAIVVSKAELGETTKVMIDNWNISVSLFLRRYVFNRVSTRTAPAWRRSWGQHITMGVSAIWHGFYPSYYFCFFFFSLLSEVSKMAYQTDFSKLPARGVLKWVAWVYMYACGNLHGIIFMQLGFPETLATLNAIYWGPYIILVATWLFFKVTGVHRSKRKQQ